LPLNRSLRARIALQALRTLDSEAIMDCGQSLGSATALAAMLLDKSLIAGANLDGIDIPVETSNASFDRPFLLIGKETGGRTTIPLWETMMTEVLQGPRLELQLTRFAHRSFPDFSVLLEKALGLTAE